METKAANNWEMFAYKHGIPKEVCDSLKPSFHVNPTKSILEFIVQRDPYATVEHFLKTLMTMEREDVVEGVLKKFFYGKSCGRMYFFSLMTMSNLMLNVLIF